ncbi:MAG TPA: potassium channel protein [Ignavibacteriaceae bacterium]|nr:potassium channel protein [Ignavibacteriaceae bacterium]
MIEKTINQLKLGASILLITLIIGTTGFMIIEKWDMLDSIYMTIITITTTGFQETHPLSHTGRIFTIVLLVLGVGSIAYTGGRAAQLLIETQIFRRRRMSKKLEELKDHYIVCGYGRMGRYICEELVAAKVDFVVIDNESDKIDRLIDMNVLYLNGDATSDETLTNAGVQKAKGLVAVLSTDAENVFTTLSAKVLNQDLYVVARAVEEETESKLKKAGANRVVKPYEIGGNRMAELLLRPGVIEFIDVVARERNVDLTMEELTVSNSSSLVGKTLSESPIRKDLNIIIVSINKIEGGFIYNPISSTKIEAGDKLIALGEKQNLSQLRKMSS